MLLSRKGGFKSHAGKFDRTRCVIIEGRGDVIFQNRHGIIYTVRLLEIVEAAKAIPGSFIIDCGPNFSYPNIYISLPLLFS